MTLPAAIVLGAGDLDGDSSTSEVDDTQFSVTCGCAAAGTKRMLSASPTPAPTPAPTPDGGCAPGDPFQVILPAVPQVEGCYVNSNFNDSAGNIIYRSTRGGESTNGLSFVLPSSSDRFWNTILDLWGYEASMMTRHSSIQENTGLPGFFRV